MEAAAASQVDHSEEPLKVQKIVEEIAVDYGTYGSEAEGRISELLKELSAADAGVGTRWTRIMDIRGAACPLVRIQHRPCNWDLTPLHQIM